jgi:two-component system chemotaxis sensor kinase CheA
MERKASLTQTVALLPEGESAAVVVSKFDYEQARESGHFVYSVEYDLIHDIERQGSNVLEVFRTLLKSGDILDCDVNFEAVGTLDDPLGNVLPLRLIYSTACKPEAIATLFSHNSEKVKLISEASLSALSATAHPAQPPQPVFIPLPPQVVEVKAPAVAPVKAVVPVQATVPLEAAPQPKVVSPAREETPVPAPAVAKHAAGTTAAPSAVVVEDSIRVSVGTLEMLMNLAGELVLGRNQLRASIAQKNARALKAADQRINQITCELQDVVMQTRLQPIGNVFGKFPRLVRDLSATLKKEIQLEIIGKDVALDRTLIESLSDPLTHMVRNSVDHGVELPADRVKAGKPSHGSITIEARHEAGQVVVEIIDDGRGIDPERIARVALEKGLMTAERLDAMSAKDKAALIFLPGLSTTKQANDVSGRGVGMDVVKTNLDRLGGKVEIISTVGKGTTFRIKLPLTLAIIPSLIVSVEGERFAIPQSNVQELRHVLPDAAKTRIEVVGDAEVLQLRDRLIPLVRFADLLGVVPTYVDPEAGGREVDRRTRLADRRSRRYSATGEETTESLAAEALHPRKKSDRRHIGGALEIVVVNTGTQTYGLVVGSFHDTEEIVVKPLGTHLKGLEEYAGATILGDGSVALILDVGGLAVKAKLDAFARATRAREQAQEASLEQSADSQQLILFHNPPNVLCATPLDTVMRIEHIAAKQVEMVGGRRTMQYHGGSLPLVTLADTAQVDAIGADQELAVMIANIRGHDVGLLGAMPVDIVETDARIDQSTHRQKGVAGSTIIQGRTALVIDLYELVDGAWPEWAVEQSLAQPKLKDAKKKTVLVAEDSDFFRTQVCRFLNEDGYTVLSAADGEAAWELLEKNLEKVRAVVTDIEMPRLDGLGLTRRIRADKRTALLPVIALTSLAGDEDIARGDAAGIDDYQTKLDRDRLLERLREYWQNGTPRAVQVPVAQ